MSDDIKWGWIPNISGGACHPDKICSKIKQAAGCCFYDYDFDGDKTVVATGRYGTVEIKIRDENGICSLENKCDNDVLDDVWSEFRWVLDGCSRTVCDCAAMGTLVDRSDSVERSIARLFIDSIESDCDGLIHVIEPWFSDAKSLNEWKNLLKVTQEVHDLSSSNRLYFGRFLELYSDAFSDEDKEDLNREINARYDKVNIAYDHIVFESEQKYKERADTHTIRSIWVAIFMVSSSLIVGILGLL